MTSSATPRAARTLIPTRHGPGDTLPASLALPRLHGQVGGSEAPWAPCGSDLLPKPEGSSRVSP